MVTEQQTARRVLPGNVVEAAIFDLLSQEPVHVDQIGIQGKLPTEQISTALALMELKGMVSQVGGMSYFAVREAKAAYIVENKRKNDERKLLCCDHGWWRWYPPVAAFSQEQPQADPQAGR
jgi:hypothetical protein